MPGMRGPDLTKVGAKAEYTKEWLSEHIRDAKKHSPSSRMPPFPADKISDADLTALVDYLASRKDSPPPGKDKDDKKDGTGKDGKKDGEK
jgi:cbb3-type cytochrome oxidase cytochrome c subunit